jgi:hypothetical protein
VECAVARNDRDAGLVCGPIDGTRRHGALGPLADTGRAEPDGFERKCGDDLERRIHVGLVVAIERPSDGGTGVVDLGTDAWPPSELSWASETGAGFAREGRVVQDVTASQLVGFLAAIEPLECVLPECLQQAIARCRQVRVVDGHHRLGDQLAQNLEDIDAIEVCSRDRVGGFRVKAPREHAEPVEQLLFTSAEQRVGPVDGGP